MYARLMYARLMYARLMYARLMYARMIDLTGFNMRWAFKSVLSQVLIRIIYLAINESRTYTDRFINLFP